MKAVFVHDHIFPKYLNDYYESSGFDNKFVNRYIDIFGNITIIAREKIFNTPLPEKFSKLSEDGLSFLTFKSSKSIIFKKYSVIKSELKECDCAVIRVPSILGIIASSICKKNNIPYIIEVVGCPWDAVASRGIIWKIPALCFALLTRYVVKNAKYVVYVTEEFLEKRYPTKGEFINCSNVTLESYGECDISARTKRIQDFDKNHFLIGTCASVDTPYKAQDDVIKAISLLKKQGILVEYQIAGGGNSERLKNLARSLDVINQVKFLGELKHADVFSWLDNIDIYVHPSKQEGLCRAIIEAMSRALPIIGADAGGIHEQISDSYIFKPGNVVQLANLLKNLDVYQLEEMSKENYICAAKYKSDILYKKRTDFFKKCINESLK